MNEEMLELMHKRLFELCMSIYNQHYEDQNYLIKVIKNKLNILFLENNIAPQEQVELFIEILQNPKFDNDIQIIFFKKIVSEQQLCDIVLLFAEKNKNKPLPQLIIQALEKNLTAIIENENIPLENKYKLSPIALEAMLNLVSYLQDPIEIKEGLFRFLNIAVEIEKNISYKMDVKFINIFSERLINIFVANYPHHSKKFDIEFFNKLAILTYAVFGNLDAIIDFLSNNFEYKSRTEAIYSRTLKYLNVTKFSLILHSVYIVTKERLPLLNKEKQEALELTFSNIKTLFLSNERLLKSKPKEVYIALVVLFNAKHINELNWLWQNYQHRINSLEEGNSFSQEKYTFSTIIIEGLNKKHYSLVRWLCQNAAERCQDAILTGVFFEFRHGDFLSAFDHNNIVARNAFVNLYKRKFANANNSANSIALQDAFTAALKSGAIDLAIAFAQQIKDKKFSDRLLSPIFKDSAYFIIKALRLKNPNTFKESIDACLYYKTDDVIREFIKEEVKELKVLNLGSLNLEDRHIRTICAMLQEAGIEIIVLNLSHNKITNDGVVCLASYLGDDNAIQHLNLSGNKISPSGVSQLINSLKKNITLQVIDLHDNLINKSQIKILNELLAQNHHLANCLLTDTITFNATAVHLLPNKFFNIFIPNISNISSVCIGESLPDFLLPKCINILANAKWRLKFLHIERQDLQALSAEAEFKTLCNQANLFHAITLDNCKLNDVFVKDALIRLIEKSSQLIELNVLNDPIGFTGAWRLAAALAEHPTLEVINLTVITANRRKENKYLEDLKTAISKNFLIEIENVMQNTINNSRVMVLQLKSSAVVANQENQLSHGRLETKSLLKEGFVVTFKNWMISLACKKDTEHSMLLVEGIENGKHFITKYDLVAPGTRIIGVGKVRKRDNMIDSIEPDDYLHNYYEITHIEGLLLDYYATRDEQIEHNFSKFFPSTSDEQVNCAKWCIETLEKININVNKSPLNLPSQISGGNFKNTLNGMKTSINKW